MWHRKTLKVAVSATRLDLDRLMVDQFDWPEDKLIGAAIMTTSNKKISSKQLEQAGERVSCYLEAKTCEVTNKSKQAGPFIFGIRRDEDLLSFIRDIESDLRLCDECDNMKLELRLQ